MAFNYLRTIEVTDVIDIAVTAFLIYKVITFILRTSSTKGFKGILLIVVALWLSTLFKLNVINYLLSKTVQLGFISIIVLFQPELRRALERVGSGKLFSFFDKEADESKMEIAVRETIDACADMSSTKTGALIIFEKEIKLDEYIKTGTIVNADTTSELLRTIFFLKSPLHDGAVIVRNGEITAAACMLPLTKNPNLSRDLGMRHRAGLGMSEVSDAVVAIVSEETGSISVAIDGKLRRHLALDTFESLLRNELIAQEDKKRSAVEMVRNTLKVKRDAARKNKKDIQ